MDLLAHAFADREHTADRNSFVRRIASEPNKLAFEINFLNGSSFAKTIGDGRFVEDSDVVYIAQGELEKYIDENSDLNQYIHRLIFNSAAVKDTVDAFDYQSIETSVAGLQADLDSKNHVIAQLESKTASSVRDGIVKAGKQARAEREDVTKRVAALESKLSQDKIALNTAKQEGVAKAKALRDRLLKAKDLCAGTLRAIDTDLTRLANAVVQLNELLAQLGLGGPLATPAYPDRNTLLEVGAKIDGQLRAVVQEIDKQEHEVKQLAEELREHNRLLSRGQELDARIAALAQQWKELKAQETTLVTEKELRTALLKKLLETTIQQRVQYATVIGMFTDAKEPILTDLDFQAQVSYDALEFLENADAIVDKRQVEVEGNDRVQSAFQPLLNLCERLALGDDAVVDQVVSEVDRLALEISNKLKKASVPEQLYSILYRSYFSVHPIALYKNTALDRLSLGQKATVLMKIYLAEGENPIIIDSHDDHLDNEYIMDELVGAIRHAKMYRQVVVASNNGNVVVNSDAEQVVVAQRVNGVVSYTAGSLEDPGIRMKALKVLEGGEEAFRRRQEKYRMS